VLAISHLLVSAAEVGDDASVAPPGGGVESNAV